MIVCEPVVVLADRKPKTSKIDRHIAVIAADSTGMKETGFGSIETCLTIFEVLKGHYKRVEFHAVSTRADLERIATIAPDLAVLCGKYVVEKRNETKIWFSEFFSSHGIEFTGSDRAGLEFDSNKSKAKTVLLNKGIATAKFFLARPGQYQTEQMLPIPLPLFIKPLDAANGNGIDENSIAHDFAGYEAKVAELFAIYGVAPLVEELLPGREYSVAILDDTRKNKRQVWPVEIIAPQNTNGDRILGSREKSNNSESLHNVAEPLLSAVSRVAEEAFSALGAREFGRIDVKLDAKGVPHFIEANLVPGMTPDTSYFPRACAIGSAATGHDSQRMTQNDVVLKITEAALSRVGVAAAL